MKLGNREIDKFCYAICHPTKALYFVQNVGEIDPRLSDRIASKYVGQN